MSTTIDQKVVEMRFDNQHFEKNVGTTLSTLDKLKQKLNLTGSAKGLEDLGTAAKKVDMNGLGSGVESVRLKFSALQVMGVTALTRITNAAINTGERMVKALTIDPIKTGFKEYETQMNAVQTILANTKSKGSTLDDVNKALSELNKYADQTIYNFTEMTNNIGKFTSAGVDLQTSVDSIKGIANLAAVSGSSSQQASTAMYQLSQALAAGRVSLMDWNSVVNAGMGGELFQNALIRTSELLKTGAKDAIAAHGSFRESLTKGEWLTTEVLTETLKQISGAYTEAELIAQGFTKAQAKEITELAGTAISAAQDIKTFTQLWGVMKESAQSGWAQTWQLIVGDFEEAKALLTPIGDFFTGENGLITKMSEARNKLVGGALGKGFKKLGDTVRTALEPATKAMDVVKDVTSAVGDLGKVVDDVILGKFGNGKDRFDALSKAGINYYEVQNKVNEKLGDAKRYTKEQIEAQNKVLGIREKANKVTSETTSATNKLTEEQKKEIKSWVALAETQEGSSKLTKEQVTAVKELHKVSKKLGIPMNDLIDNLDELNGRWLLWRSFANIGQAILKIFTAIGDAWKATFKPITSNQLFDAIAGFHKFTDSLIMSTESVEKLTSVFKGLFAILDIVTTVIGGGFKIAAMTISKLLDALGTDALTFAAGLGEAVAKFRDFLFDNKLVNGVFELIATGITKAVEAIDKFIDSISNNTEFKNFVEGVKEFFGALFSDGVGDSSEVKAEIEGVSDSFSVTEKAAHNFKRILEGVFSGLDLSWSLASASVMGGIKILNEILKLFGTDFVSILGWIADGISKVNKWVEEDTIFGSNTKWEDLAKIFVAIYEGISGCVKEFAKLDVVGKIIKTVSDAVKELFGSFDGAKNFLSITNITNAISEVFENIQKWIRGLNSSENLGRDIVLGIAKGIGASVNFVADAIRTIATTVMNVFCSLLGIHSPSKVFYEYGKNIVEGLGNGIQEFITIIDKAVRGIGTGIKKVFEALHLEELFDGLFSAIKYVYTNFINLLKDLDFTKLLAVIPVAVTLIALKKLYDLVKIFADGISNLNDVVGGLAKIEKSFAGVLDAFAADIKAKAIQKLAISLAILVGSVVALTMVDHEKLYAAVGTIVILGGVLAALAFAMSKLDTATVKFDKEKGINIDGLKTSLVAIGAAILLIAAATKIMGTMNAKEFKQGLLGMAAVVGALAAVFIAFGLVSKYGDTSNVDKVGRMLIKLSIALLLMVGVCKLIGTLSPDELIMGASFVSTFVGFTMLLMVASQFVGEHADKIGGMVLKLSIALALMVGVCKLIGTLTVDEMLHGAKFAAGFLVFVAGLVLVSKMFPQAQIQKISGMVFALSLSLLLLVGVCKLVSLLEPAEMFKGAAFAAGFLVFVAALVKITKIGKEEQIAKVSATILAMSIAIGVLAGVCILMGLLDAEMLKKGCAAIIVFGSVMTAMIWATRGAADVGKSITAMAIAIGVMAGAVAILSFIKWEKLAGAAGALGSVMLAFAVVAKASSGLGGTMGALIVMTAIVGLMGFVIYKLAELPFESSLGASASMSMLLLSLASAMAIIGRFGRMGPTAMVGALAMTIVVELLALILKQLVGVDGIENALTVAKSLSTLILALSACCLILAVAGAGGPAAIIGIGALLALIIAVGALMMAIGKLATENEKIETFVNKAIPLLQKIGEGLGSFFGGIIKGFSTAVISIIPMLGAALGSFSASITPFIAVAKTVDMDVLKGIGILALAIGALTAASLISGVASFLPFGSDFASLGMQLSAFITGAGPFLAAIQNIDPKAVEAANTLAKMIMTLSKAELMNSIASFFGMEVNFSDFGAQLTAFGEAIVAFSKEVSGNIDPSAIEAAAAAGTLMAELQKSLPKSGGWLQEIAGEQDLAKFGAACESFGKSIAAFCKSVSGDNAVDPAAAESAASAGRIMAELQNALPKTGGWIQVVAGEQDLAAFGKSCVAFGKSISEFCRSVRGDNAIDVEAATKASNAGKVMAELQNALPKTGGWIQAIAGEQDLVAFGASCVAFGKAISDFSSNVDVDEEAVTTATNAGKMLAAVQKAIPSGKWFDGKISLDEFGGKIKAFGKSISQYSESVADINTDAVTSSLTAADKIVTIAKGAAGIDPDVVDNFSEIKTIGKAMKSYSEAVSEVDSAKVSSSITAATKIKNFIAGLAGLDTSGVSSYKSAVASLGKTNVDGVVESFAGSASKLSLVGTNMITSIAQGMRTGQSSLNTASNTMINGLVHSIGTQSSAFRESGIKVMSQFVSGVTSAKAKVANAINSPIASSLMVIRSYYTSFYNAGSYLVTGFANGISMNSFRATAKARAMAEAAIKAARETLKINSPSKVFREIGSGVPEGFAQGIGMLGNLVAGKVHSMADNAIDSTKNVMSRIAEAVNTDIDTQPTIRPVLDLSDVSAGANSISSMFGMTPSVGLMANVNGVSAMMNGYGQNGNGDVISAINKLGKKLSETGNTTYTINGVNYSGESDVANAIKTLTRAAIMERRS